tara:strand:- start:4126 stop:4611 length:486 start_codon:yes stop_codon:yes gene_type:complete
VLVSSDCDAVLPVPSYVFKDLGTTTDDDTGDDMAIDIWEPQQPLTVTTERLSALAAQMSDAESGNLASLLGEEGVKRDAGLMTQPEENWSVAESLSNEDIVRLVRFFTLAEMQLPGWEAGKRSPVIPLVKILKARSTFTPELRKWIKASADNRYLPNGAAL